MPTNRRRRTRKQRRPISEAAWAYLTDAPLPQDADKLDVYLLGAPGNGQGRALWEAYRDEILADWIQRHSGTRPSSWWRWDAPRCPVGTWPGCDWDGKLPQPRKRFGGMGTPRHEVLAYVPSFVFGIPDNWVDQFDAEYYKAGGFEGVPIDPDDPPVFESQAAYLKRHGLLTTAERKALGKVPDAFEPEVLNPEIAPESWRSSP